MYGGGCVALLGAGAVVKGVLTEARSWLRGGLGASVTSTGFNLIWNGLILAAGWFWGTVEGLACERGK